VVESVFEFGEILRRVLAVDGAVGSGDGGLDVAKSGVDLFEVRGMGRQVFRNCVDDLIRTSRVGHAFKVVQAVGDYGAIGTEAASGKFQDRRPAEAGKQSQLHTSRLRAMPPAVPLRTDFSARELRRLARKYRNNNQSRRLLSLAAVLDGMSRDDAARIGGMDRQTLRDWVHRFNTGGPEALLVD
jgi:hypothetical protein